MNFSELIHKYILHIIIIKRKAVFIRAEAIILMTWALLFLAIPIILPIMLTDFNNYSQNYAWRNAHGIRNGWYTLSVKQFCT